ncbi:MAG: ABC transporter substrate-binding protein, partial [Bacteroidota bacterium]
MPTISEDGLKYTFKIKQGVKFHDNPCFAKGKGRELIADDFVYAIKRVADPKVQSPWFSLLSDKIQGLDAWRNTCVKNSTTDYTVPLAGVKALDNYTLQFTLSQPSPQFLYILAMTFCSVVPEEAVAHYGDEFLNHPVGTGPFTLTAFNPQLNKLVYHKNPTFRDKRFPSEAAPAYQHMLADAGKKLPFVDKVITHIQPEEQPRWLKFQQGQVDIVDISRDNIALEVVKEGQLMPSLQEKGIQLFSEYEQGVSFIAINCGHKLFKNNLKLRQALSLAFDYDRYNTLFHDGTAISAQSIIPPGLAGYQQTYVNPYKVHNLTKAKALLAAAGYPEGKGLPAITLDVTANTNDKQKGEFIQKCLEQLGISIKVTPNIWPEQIKKIHQKTTMLHSLCWSADYPDAENFLSLLYQADQNVGIGTNFSDATYNTLYEKATVMQPSAARTALYEQLGQIAAESVPAIYTVHQAHPIIYHGWVKNYLFSDFHYGTEQYIDIDLEQKEALK